MFVNALFAPRGLCRKHFLLFFHSLKVFFFQSIVYENAMCSYYFHLRRVCAVVLPLVFFWNQRQQKDEERRPSLKAKEAAFIHCFWHFKDAAGGGSVSVKC